MASAGNPNQPFDVQMLFKPSNPNNNPNPPHSPSYPTSPSPYPTPPPGPFSYPPPTATTPYHQLLHYPQDQLANVRPHKPITYPTPPPNPNPGARLMALLTPNASSSMIPSAPAAPSSEPSISGNPQISPSILPSSSSITQPVPASSKLPKGRCLVGNRVVYDVDVRLPGEAQPQLEVTPITKYVSDPGLVVGRQIAVNRAYICYGLKLGAIRVLNIHTALRALLRGHTQRVTDMAFFAEDVHLLASASIDGRIFVWKINEGPDEEDKPQITGKAVIAIEIVGDGKSLHPRVCWHSHKQEILVVAIGRRVLKVDTTKVGKGEVISAEEPVKCPVEKLIDGIQLVGKHDGEVTDLSMCQWMTTRLVSAAKDGTVKIWEDRKALPLVTLRPHDGQPVNSVTFLTAPHRPDHTVLITAGYLNQDVKVWASESDEGWLLPSDAESWQCTQSLDLKSSSEPRVEEAFFNQVVALPQAGLILLANAKRNAIYAIHVEYGPNPAATRMDYLAEFTVTMPILSLTGTSDCLPDGEHVIQVYCVQTHAIQQYALNLSQCLPPSLENVGLEKDSCISCVIEAPNSNGFASFGPFHTNSMPEMPRGSLSPMPELATSSVDSKSSTIPPATTDSDNAHIASLPLSPNLSGKLSGFRSPPNSFDQLTPLSDCGVDPPVLDYSVDRRVDAACMNLSDVPSVDVSSGKDETKIGKNDISMAPSPIPFKHPTHLITPSEILSKAVSSSETTHVTQGLRRGETKVQDVTVNNDMESVEVDIKVVGESRSGQNGSFDSQSEQDVLLADKKEKPFCSQASELSMEMVRECRLLSTETFIVEETRQIDDGGVTEASEQPFHGSEEGVSSSNLPEKGVGSSTVETVTQSPLSAARAKKQKGKPSQLSGHLSPFPSPFNSTDSLNEPGSSMNGSNTVAAFSQILNMQEMLNQLMTLQKEMQRQMAMTVSVPVCKEGKRIEVALGRSMEKAVKSNIDSLWTRFQEENSKREKSDHSQQIASLISNSMNKDLPAMLEKTMKKEISTVGQTVARAVTPIVEKTISSAITDSFQRGVGDKAVNQLEKSISSKLEATVARQIQAQFQTLGKQALQDALKSSIESSVVPAFELSCKAMLGQVDSTFRKGMVEHTTAAQQQFESTHSPLAVALRDAINSASTITQTLNGELADGQRKLLALAAAGANPKAVNPLVTQLSNGPLGGFHEMVEAPLDPTKELTRLIFERKFEEAFTSALQRSDVSIVSWLCSQVDLQGILSMVPVPLSQGVLLSLLQQLSCDLNKETSRKLSWMTDIAVAINPTDPMISVHVRPIFEQVYQILGHQRALPTTTSAEANSIRLVMHVINSVLMSSK